MKTKIKNLWRPAYEIYASGFWLLSVVCTALIGVYGDYGIRFMLLSTLPMSVFCLIRAYQGIKILNKRARLTCTSKMDISLEDLIKWTQKNPGKVLYGLGYYWNNNHTQQLYELKETDVDKLKVPSWYADSRRMLGLDTKHAEKGQAYIHTINDNEQEITGGLGDRYAHESISGTTRAGKGRKLSFDLIQAITRGEGCIIIDPKGDDNLLDLINATLKILGQEHRLNCFLPVTPSASCRINPYANFTEITELTQRTLSILNGNKDDVFKDFAWRAVNIVLQGLYQAGETLSLTKLTEYLDTDIDDILVLVGRHHLKQYPEMHRVIKECDTTQKTMEQKAKFITKHYEENVKKKHPNQILNNIIGIFKQNREHYKKLYMNIMSPLTQVTSGSIRDLLSPTLDSQDPRPIVDLHKIAHKGEVLYINLNSVNEKTLGDSMGSLLMAEVISVVADRYNSFNEDELIPLNVYGDESSDYVNDPAINVANKSGGSKTCFKFYYQTVDDLQVRLGTQEKSNQLLGNSNTKTALRLKGLSSMESFTDILPKTTISRLSEAVNTQTTTPSVSTDFNTGYGKQSVDTEVGLLPPETLGLLMDMHMFTQFPGGELAKIRLPFIPCPEEYKFKPIPYEFDEQGELSSLEELTRIKIEEIRTVRKKNKKEN